jgi:hypothetical protein
VFLIVRDLRIVQLPADYNEDFGYMLIELDNDLALFHVATLAVCEDASLLAEVRTGNISLGVLPGSGDKT